jgi:chemotaxis-related protein WspD
VNRNSSKDRHAVGQSVETAPPQGSAEVAGCWSDIGVYGSGSCLDLQKFVHCRNCPVYSTAATKLLDRPLPRDYRQEWSQHFADDKRLPEAGNASAIVFRIHSEWLALPTHSFQEVAEKRPIHSLPSRGQGVVIGLANVRGELVMCVSLGHLLHMERVDSLETLRVNYRRLLVIQWEANRLAFPVADVQGPVRFHSRELKPVPSTLVRSDARYTQGVLTWRDCTAGFLNPALLFSNLERTLS